MKVTVIGVGLIGGSMVLDMRRRGLTDRVWGVDTNTENLKRAEQLRIVDEGKDLEEGCRDADLVILAIPVKPAKRVLNQILDAVGDHTLVIDVGSTKSGICETIGEHPHRKQFVACHPIAGTEFSGPDAAHEGLFKGKINIICNAEESDPGCVERAGALFAQLGMTTTYMDAVEHDRHIAYVSHLSHITSFTLGLTVLDIEKDEKHIFNMAGSGFESTVRLAKSSADMWTPIFEQNRDNLLEALDAYREKLSVFREAIAHMDGEKVNRMIRQGNDIKRILEGIELRKKQDN